MTPPATVGPYLYRLEQHDTIRETDKIGDCDESRLLIRYVGADIDPQQIRSTVLHEVLHACALTAGIDTTVKLDQETLIGRVEPILFGVLRDNPDLVKWLQAGA